MAGGRPRAFDVDEALDRALEVFWRQGYEGTALSDLTAAMGINRPSLYATFGNKEALFRQVLDRYAHGPASYAASALELPRARDVVEALVYGAIELTTGDQAGPLASGLSFCAFSSIVVSSAAQSALNAPAPWRCRRSARASTSTPASATAEMIRSAAA